MNIIEKLENIQAELKAPKSQENTFGKYKYRSAEDILEAVKPICRKYDCGLILSDDMKVIGDRYYIEATATLIEYEGDEVHKLEAQAFARESESKKGMDASQITGTASSYARKYALNGLFCIDDTKDADTDEYVKKTRGKKEDKEPEDPALQEKIDAVKVNTIIDMAAEKQVDIDKILDNYGIDKVEDMTGEQYGNCLNRLKATKKGGKG